MPYEAEQKLASMPALNCAAVAAGQSVRARGEPCRRRQPRKTRLNRCADQDHDRSAGALRGARHHWSEHSGESFGTWLA